MKNLFSVLIVMAMAVVCITSFTACSKDDDNDLDGLEVDDLTVGTHRVDVDFEGDTKGWDVIVSYCGSTYPVTVGGSNLYENGKQLETSSTGVWINEEFRSYSVSTDNKSCSLVVGINLLKHKGAVVQPVTINMKGFVNDKLKTVRSILVDGSHSYNTINFHSEVENAFQEIYLDY